MTDRTIEDQARWHLQEAVNEIKDRYATEKMLYRSASHATIAQTLVMMGLHTSLKAGLEEITAQLAELAELLTQET